MEGLVQRSSIVWASLGSAVPLLAAFAGWVVVAYLAQRHATRSGAPREALGNVGFWAPVGGLLMGRLVAMLSQGRSFSSLLEVMQINAGVSFYGFLAGALLVGWWRAHRHGLDIWHVAGWYATFAPLGVAVARLGCLADGFCGGRHASPPWGLVLPGSTLPRYPSDLYEALLALGLFFVLLSVRERGCKGTMLPAFLGGYGLARALVTLTRSAPAGPWLGIDVMLSLGIGVAGILLARRMWLQLDKTATDRAS